MIYVHVPFCRSFCTYCDFYSEIACRGKDAEAVERYVSGLCEEAARRRDEIAGTVATDTLYIGGGTPSVLPLIAFRRILDALGGGRAYSEFTVEVNPEDIVEKGAEYASGLRALGVNRISMGVQSLDDGLLRWMNRRHDADGARKAFRILREAGFDNISVDVIFGISRPDAGTLARTLDELISWGPEHVSAYQLSIEEDSALEKMVADGRYTEASDEQCRGQYDTLCRKLAEAGYVHYEISNWARPGREAVHNSAYWRRVPYVGLGPGAHSLAFPGSADPHSPRGEQKPRFCSQEVPLQPRYEQNASFCSEVGDEQPQNEQKHAFCSSGGIRSWNSQELPRREADGRLVRWRSGHEAPSSPKAPSCWSPRSQTLHARLSYVSQRIISSFPMTSSHVFFLEAHGLWPRRMSAMLKYFFGERWRIIKEESLTLGVIYYKT